MQAITLILQASLLAPLVEFATSSSGHVEPRQGLALGWLGSVVAGLAVVFGTAERTQAGYCHGIPPGQSDWGACTNDICAEDHHGNGLAAYKYFYSHDSATDNCIKMSSSCSCPP